MLAMPFIEIAGFVIVGSEIGVLATLGLVILSAMLGFFCCACRASGFCSASAWKVPQDAYQIAK